MSSRDFFQGAKIATAQDLDTSFESDPVKVSRVNQIGFNVSTSGVTAGTGTFQVQHRVWVDDNHCSAWTTLTLDSTPTMASADAQFLLDVTVPPGQVRVKYTESGSADGTCDIWVSGVES